jgi:hypothetical protein
MTILRSGVHARPENSYPCVMDTSKSEYSYRHQIVAWLFSTSFVNRTIKSWNQSPAALLASFPCKLNTRRKSVNNTATSKGIQVEFECKYVSGVECSDVECSDVECSDVERSDVECSDVEWTDVTYVKWSGF